LEGFNLVFIARNIRARNRFYRDMNRLIPFHAPQEGIGDWRLPAFALTPGLSLTEDGRANFEAIQSGSEK
jgi:hypothetical protein